jgi:hypothetical protein
MYTKKKPYYNQENIVGNTRILTSQLQTHKDLLAKKIAELERLEILEKELVSVINDNLEKIPGLCIRSLNKHLLSIRIIFESIVYNNNDNIAFNSIESEGND